MSQPGSLFKSVGLSTEAVIPDVSGAVKSTLDRLYEHASLDFANCHGLWKIGDVNLYDQHPTKFFGNSITGRKIATKAFLVKINEASWLMPCSPSADGVTQIPRNLGLSSIPPNGLSANDDPPPITFTATATGSCTMVFTWQIMWMTYATGQTQFQWVNMPSAGIEIQCVESRVLASQYTINYGSTVINGNVSLSTTAFNPDLTGVKTVTSTVLISIYPNPGNNSWEETYGQIRCQVSNAAIGGAVKYTPGLLFKAVDSTG